MTREHLPHSTDSPPIITCESPEFRTVVSYNRRLTGYRRTEIRLRMALARDLAQLRQKVELIQNQALLSKESDHRLLNDQPVIVSPLSLQRRSSVNAEVAFAEDRTSERV